MFRLFALSLTLVFPSLEDRLHLPYADLLTQPADYSPDEFKALRASLERERESRVKTAEDLANQWSKDLEGARDELKKLNAVASFDAAGAAQERATVHVEVAALERGIREKIREQETTIPAEFDSKLTKLWLLEHWPERQAEIDRRIEEGKARDRRFGDIDDIGYRLIVDDPDKDVEAGRQAARQAVANGWLPPELEDEDTQRYVRQLAARIAANSDLKIPLHVTVLDSPELQAIALPGGFLYVASGVIRAAQTETEVAGVLSREIARIAAPHGTRTSAGTWFSRLFVPVAQVVAGLFTGGASPAAYYGIGYGVEGLGGLVSHVLGNSDEKYQKEADQLGIQYAWNAGFDPAGFIRFLDSTAANQPESP